MTFPAWWPNHIQAAIPLAEVKDWTYDVDVVVVGYGGAGVCAALEAANNGLSVVALDRSRGGGATAINGGVYYAGGGTKTQIDAGVADTAEAMFNYLKIEVDGVVSDETLRRFCDQSVPDHDWLVEHGVGFKPILYAKKTSYPPTEYYLYHSDSSLAKRYADVVPPAARGHRVDMEAGRAAVGYGRAFYQPLREAAKAAGVQDLTETVVEALVTDETGTVCGVRARRIPEGHKARETWRQLNKKIIKMSSVPRTWPGASWFDAQVIKLSAKAMDLLKSEGETVFLRARKGVVIAAGGHIFNRDMVRQFSPDYIKGLPLGTPADDGSGVALGVTAGGAMTGMERISAWRFINPPYSWAKGPLVNSDGDRFIDETLYGAAIGKAMCEGRDGKAWIILDRDLAKIAKTEATAKEVLDFQKWPALMAMLLGRKKASTLEGLAKALGVPAERLTKTIEVHNSVARGEQSDPFDKRNTDSAQILKGPFYAVNVSSDAALFPLPTLSLGGLSVDEETGQVKAADGRPVAGLFAAGRSALGVCSNIYVSGLSVADCVFSGRRAGKSIAAQSSSSKAA